MYLYFSDVTVFEQWSHTHLFIWNSCEKQWLISYIAVFVYISESHHCSHLSCFVFLTQNCSSPSTPILRITSSFTMFLSFLPQPHLYILALSFSLSLSHSAPPSFSLPFSIFPSLQGACVLRCVIFSDRSRGMGRGEGKEEIRVSTVAEGEENDKGSPKASLHIKAKIKQQASK